MKGGVAEMWINCEEGFHMFAVYFLHSEGRRNEALVSTVEKSCQYPKSLGYRLCIVSFLLHEQGSNRCSSSRFYCCFLHLYSASSSALLSFATNSCC